MDFGRGLAYIRQDPTWLVKTLLGSLISMVPILNFAATGYGLDVLRNVYQGRETPLPEWGEQFGERFVRGLLGLIIQFIYLLPIIVLAFGFGIWASIQANRIESGGDGAGTGTAALCLVPLMIVAYLVLFLAGMVAQARYAVTNEFSQALRVGAVLSELRNGIGRWLGILLMLLVLAIALLIVVVFTCGLGLLLSFYVTLVQFHWMAQAYRQTPAASPPSISGM